jgi:molybdate transport system substrate-binding protein
MVIATVIIVLGFSMHVQAAETVTVFAAASLTNALTDLGAAFEKKGAGKAIFSFAASSTLAKQIENGAPANVFISADEEWMNYLSRKGLMIPASQRVIVRNRLVLVAPRESAAQLDVKPGFSLVSLMGDGLLAVGDPDHVPAGRYAKMALQRLGVWAEVETKLARADNVRAALALVERGECPLGVVYATDAAISKGSNIVGTFPESSHPPVTYPAGIVSGKDSPGSRDFLEFLESPEAKSVFEKYGFVVR